MFDFFGLVTISVLYNLNIRENFPFIHHWGIPWSPSFLYVSLGGFIYRLLQISKIIYIYILPVSSIFLLYSALDCHVLDRRQSVAPLYFLWLVRLHYILPNIILSRGPRLLPVICRNLLSIDSRLNRIDPSTNIFPPNPEQGYRTKFEILLEEVFPNSI